MTSTAATPAEYLQNLPEERKAIMEELHQAIVNHLPAGFEACMGYGMIGYVVPKSLYPAGYHCDPKVPLPFAGLASQKGHISFYHMGLYSDPTLMAWFVEQWPKYSKKKLDMGKSCVRFKKPEDVPVELIASLCTKMTTRQWIDVYEAILKR